MSEIEAYKRRYEREKQARLDAEKLLLLKSQELYDAHAQTKSQATSLKKAERRLREVINTGNDAYFATDVSGVIVDWSDRAADLFGWPADEILGENIAFNLLSNAPPGVNPVLLLLGDDARGRRVEMPAACKGGGTLPAEFSISPMRTDGQFVINVFAHDVTNRRALQVQLSHAQKMESVGQLAAGIAHEINTPTQYVGDNLRFLQESYGELRSLLDAYGKLASVVSEKGEPTALLESIAEAVEEADLEFLMDEIPAAVAQGIEGIERVAKIVRAMKDFSHPGSQEKTAIDLNQ
ncbi:MAG: PAS domain S-box protein, partial [Planctomycetales bacterium]|nr:PAS domain S-box protein [Planctomycetales bacterium]